MAIFGHSKFVPVSLGKIVRKNLKQPFLAILNLYQSFCEKLLEKIQNGINLEWPVILGKIDGKNLEQPFLAITNLYQKLLEKFQNGNYWPFQIYTSLFGKNCQKKFRTAIFGHSEFIPVFLGKFVGKNSECHYWPF